MRERLPNRRPGVGFTIQHPPGVGMIYDIMVGHPDVADNRVLEVFVNAKKLHTDQDIAAQDAAKLISLALQHGATVAELAAAMKRKEDGSPEGLAGAVLDAVAAYEAA